MRGLCHRSRIIWTMPANAIIVSSCLAVHHVSKLQVTFWLNGRSLGVAFTGVRTFEPHLAYFPALSLSEGESSYVNLGGQPLRYPVEGFRPFMAPAAPGRVMACDWLLGKLKELCLVLSSSVATASACPLPQLAFLSLPMLDALQRFIFDNSILSFLDPGCAETMTAAFLKWFT